MPTGDQEASTGLSRARLVSEALLLVQEEGLEALSMRGLADRLHVKAASLYWHVRDRRELLDLLGESILDGGAVPRATPPTPGPRSRGPPGAPPAMSRGCRNPGRRRGSRSIPARVAWLCGADP